jgi:ADP-dependent NAD(P)H-hydrate dehydratase / NAD(P)H-hydrate epimerase
MRSTGPPHRSAAVFGRAWVPVVTPVQAAALDRSARETAGVPERVLMENAGRAAALVLDRLQPRGRIAIVAGSGNNGGDAAVVTRVLSSWGRDVALIAVGSRRPDPALLHQAEIQVHEADALEERLAWADFVVDGILGTGLQGPAGGNAGRAIEAVNGAGRPVLSLDLPSGIEGATGRVAGPAVHAATTVCFGWPKLGLLFQPARSHCGRLIVAEIGFPPLISAEAALITPAWAAARLPQRTPDAHKGSAGRVLIVAGGDGMAGAAVLAGLAAMRAGAGLVRLSSAAVNRTIVQTLLPEATFIAHEDLAAEDGALAHALVLGPGLGTDADARRTMDVALSHTRGKPTLLDADALNLLAEAGGKEIGRLASERPLLLTPHPGELQRLTGRPIEETRADPAAAARETADAFGCTVLLKGQPSVVASPDSPLLVNSAGSSDTAAAGMGDQLAGAIGALLAAGCDPREAAAVGLFFSSRAADLCGRGRGLGPRDVADALPAAFSRPGSPRSSLGLPFVTFDQEARR